MRLTHATPVPVRTRDHGASLIELMVGITLMGLLISLGIPTFSDWLRNAQIRTAAESIQNGLQFARTEAVRRNTSVRFQLTSSLDSSCSLVTDGAYWLVNMGSDVSPSGKCDDAASDTASPFILQRSPAGSNPEIFDITANQYAVSFNGLGQQTATQNPNISPSTLTIDVKSSSAACLGTTGGTARCLRITVSPAGQIRMCDPSIAGPGITTQTHPTAC